MQVRGGADRSPARTTTSLSLRAGGIGLIVGIGTAYAQGWLPERFASLANSAGPWMLVAFLVALVARRALDGALSSLLALVGMVLGYSIAIEVRGFESSMRSIAFWGFVAIAVGLPIGVSASWVRFGPPTLAAIGAAVPVGLLIGEGIYGLRSLSETTSPGFWIAEIILGIVLASFIVATRLRGGRSILLLLAATAVVAVGFIVVFSFDPISVF